MFVFVKPQSGHINIPFYNIISSITTFLLSELKKNKAFFREFNLKKKKKVTKLWAGLLKLQLGPEACSKTLHRTLALAWVEPTLEEPTLEEGS